MTRGSAAEILQSLRSAEAALNRKDFLVAHERCVKVLSQQPDCADALFLLAMIAVEHGNNLKALEVMDRALQLDPANAEYLAQRGRCLLALRRPREAYESVVRALRLKPRDALTLDTIGVVMTRSGAHAEAVAPFRAAVAADPEKSAYHYNLGASLQFTGEFAAAESAYRRALALDSGNYRAWASLSQVIKEPFLPDEASSLYRRSEAGQLGVDEELHLCHSLARHHENLGDYAAAFAWLRRGKRRKRDNLSYDPDQDRQLFRMARETLAHGHSLGHDSSEPIFIVGMPRTGTTLVERIISSHPRVFSAGELSNFSVAIKRITGTPTRRVLDPETLEAAAKADLAAAGTEYVASTRPRTGHTRHFIDKMPLNFFYAGLIHRALPNARIICLRRNPLDTVLSNYRQLFATSFSYYNYSYDLLDAGRYYIEFDALAKHWLATIPDNYCEVHYERVVADTEGEARRLLTFCGLEWDPACLKFEENAAPVATASSVQVRQPIYTTAVERWRKYEREIQPLVDLFRREGLID